MSHKIVAKLAEDSDPLSDIPDSSSAVFESSESLKTTTSSYHHDSEYDAASDTPSSDLEDEDDPDDGDVEDNGEEGSVVLDLDRKRLDEEQDGEKKKVVDDEDPSNPQYVPKRGVFYEHDDRTAEEPDAERKANEKPIKKSAAADRWSHDRYNENEQAPKSRAILVNSYGYDIRNSPATARRRCHYGRGPSKYAHNWEDEKVYPISSHQAKQLHNYQEEFPELGSGKAKPISREEKENKNEESRRHSNRSRPNQRSHQQSQLDSVNRSDRYYGNQTINDKFESNRQQIDQFDENRSENDRNSHSDRFHGNNRSQNYAMNRSQSDYGHMGSSRHRNVTELDRFGRPITGRQLGSAFSRGSNPMQAPLPITTPIHNQQPSMNIQQHISPQAQPQLLPQQNTNLPSAESSSAKRYSTLRQCTAEAVQTWSILKQSLSLHYLHEQPMLLQDAATMLQMQQSQEQIQLQSNLAHQPPSTNYSPMSLQLQNEYAAAQSNQQPLAQPPNQSQSANPSAQYPSAYFASIEFTTQSVTTSTSIQAAAQSTPLMNNQQYPTQYPKPPTALYVQPPPQTSYIQPAVNQQQQIMNYALSVPPAQQQFTAVQSFLTYPAVLNYNWVPIDIAQSGIRYYPPQKQPRPILSQRHPTNSIPILAPSKRFIDKCGQTRPNNNQFEEDDKTALNPPIGSPENIKHILDNKFQPPKSNSPSTKTILALKPIEGLSLVINSPSPESNLKSINRLSESPQPDVAAAGDRGNKKLDIGMGKMSLDDNTNAITVDAVIDSAPS